MKYRTQLLNTLTVKIHIVIFLAAIGTFLYGCAALQEAGEKRQKRLDEKRVEKRFMLTASKGKIGVDANPLEGKPHGESEHYTLTFSKDLLAKDKFDEEKEREIFTGSALSYMESLYDELHRIYGFKPKHKIHVTLYDLYRGTNRVAVTGTQYKYGNNIKTVTGITMHFPMAMYEKHEVRVHELTHAFTNIYFLPTWFNEGVAVLMQMEYAKGTGHPKFESLEGSLKTDLNGINELENWGGHIESTPLTHWRYCYAYTVVSELRKRFGNELYIKVFELMEADQLHQKLAGSMPTSFIVYYISQAAGVDLVPFFKNLKFNVRKIDKDDILQYIQNQNRQ